MARYFFNLLECGTYVPDEDGIEIADPAEVRAQAIREARGVIAAEVSEGKLCLSCCIQVFDEAQRLVLSLPFREAVEVSGMGPHA